MTEITTEKEPAAVPGQLLDLTITTSLDGVYVFPDFDAQEARRLIQQALATGALSGEQLTLVNASGACLVIPVRIVKGISAGPALSWVRVR